MLVCTCGCRQGFEEEEAPRSRKQAAPTGDAASSSAGAARTGAAAKKTRDYRSGPVYGEDNGSPSPAEPSESGSLDWSEVLRSVKERAGGRAAASPNNGASEDEDSKGSSPERPARRAGARGASPEKRVASPDERGGSVVPPDDTAQSARELSAKIQQLGSRWRAMAGAGRLAAGGASPAREPSAGPESASSGSAKRGGPSASQGSKQQSTKVQQQDDQDDDGEGDWYVPI